MFCCWAGKDIRNRTTRISSGNDIQDTGGSRAVQKVFTVHFRGYRDVEEMKNCRSYISQRPSAFKGAFLMGIINKDQGNRVKRMGCIRGFAIRVYHYFGVAVIRGDKHGAADKGHIFTNPAKAFVNCFTCRNRSIKNAWLEDKENYIAKADRNWQNNSLSSN